jgi:hypothetical protein
VWYRVMLELLHRDADEPGAVMTAGKGGHFGSLQNGGAKVVIKVAVREALASHGKGFEHAFSIPARD